MTELPAIINELETSNEYCECYNDPTDHTDYPNHILVEGSETCHVYMNSSDGLPHIHFECQYTCPNCGRVHTHAEDFVSTGDYGWSL